MLRSLKALDLSRNKLSGATPGAFGANGTLAGLRELNLSRNMLTGPLPAELRGLTELQKLDLSFNTFAVSCHIWGSGLKGWGALMGPLPAEMRGLGELQKLDLSFDTFAVSCCATLITMVCSCTCSNS